MRALAICFACSFQFPFQQVTRFRFAEGYPDKKLFLNKKKSKVLPEKRLVSKKQIAELENYWLCHRSNLCLVLPVLRQHAFTPVVP